MTPRPAAQAGGAGRLLMGKSALIVPALLIHALTGGHSDILIAGPVQKQSGLQQALIQECVYRPVMTKIGQSGLSFDFIHNGVGQPNHQGNGIGRFLQALGFRLGKAHVADAQ